MKKILCIIAATALLGTTVFAGDEEASKKRDAQITGELGNVADLLTDGNIENTPMLLVNPDAYIGKLFPSIPAHFTAGISVSGTIFKTADLVDPMKNVIYTMTDELKASDFGKLFTGATEDPVLDLNFDVPAKIPLPTAGVSLRIGGIILPFDIGFYGMYAIPGSLDSFKYEDFSASINYSSFGVDLRYCLVKEKGLLPKVSLGFGYTFVNESLSFDAKRSFSYDYNFTSLGGTSGTAKGGFDTAIDMDIKQHSIFAQIQVSKQLLYLFTPYIGARYSISKTDADIDWYYKTNHDALPSPAPDMVDIDRKDSKSISSDFDMGEGNAQLFGGIGLNLALFQLGLNIQWNPKSNYVTAGLLATLKI